MVEFLSPLLPLAQALKIPLLDFDKYAMRPDSIKCANEVRGDALTFSVAPRQTSNHLLITQ